MHFRIAASLGGLTQPLTQPYALSLKPYLNLRWSFHTLWKQRRITGQSVGPVVSGQKKADVWLFHSALKVPTVNC